MVCCRWTFRNNSSLHSDKNVESQVRVPIHRVEKAITYWMNEDYKTCIALVDSIRNSNLSVGIKGDSAFPWISAQPLLEPLLEPLLNMHTSSYMSVITYLHETSALREVLWQRMGKFLLKSTIALWQSCLFTEEKGKKAHWLSYHGKIKDDINDARNTHKKALIIIEISGIIYFTIYFPWIHIISIKAFSDKNAILVFAF